MNSQTRQKIAQEYNNKCQICGKDSYVLHHIVPRVLKNRNHRKNLISLCSKCHLEIHALIRKKIEQEIYKQNPNFFKNCIRELAIIKKSASEKTKN